ncbi:hypothetical protein P691DRAFT_766373 [Macrolepiota fuliginosa MF-IS2]|uniref:Uncharacterized protein n=1 Tax=Macrolepiota fuliginosa MF-IS2 TaxID=1400762 RepID=A0A9P5X0I6_9AGAR|nr:hypothetical protein P691DRAFT_766373 [Macrolepiota fuliginosa MF-IS2]
MHPAPKAPSGCALEGNFVISLVCINGFDGSEDWWDGVHGGPSIIMVKTGGSGEGFS